MASRGSRSTRKRGASRGGGGLPASAWFLAGVLIGLGVAVAAAYKGLLPVGQAPATAQATAAPPISDSTEANDSTEALIESSESRFDFFTLLPEVEVVVPEQELAIEADPATATPDPTTAYILQAGSFRNAADAEQLKARLALLGAQAKIQTVTVDDVRWHRVRIGPFQGARQTDEMRRQLRDNGIETLVLKDNS